MNLPRYSKTISFSILLRLNFLTLFLVFFTFFGQSQTDFLSKKITLKVKDQTCAQILALIEKKADCKFSYSNDYLPTETFTLKFKRTSVRNILNKLFENSNLNYNSLENRIILSLREAGDSSENQTKAKKNITLSGYLRDSKTGETLISGTVYIYELEVGVYTNEYGFFSLTIPEGAYKVEFSYLGYESKKETYQLAENQRIDKELTVLENELIEVVVTEKRKERPRDFQQQQEQIDLNQVKKLPTLLGEIDVVRSLEFLPGVQILGDGGGGFSVRGGSNDQNLILLDEAPIHNPSHIFGIFSIFNPDAIQSIRLMRTHIPTKYRGRLASVMDVRMKEGNNKKFGGSGGIGLLTARLKFEGRLFKDRSSFMVAGRRSYFDWIIRPFTETNQRSFIYDFNTKFNLKISEKDHIYFSAYIGRDVFETPEQFSLIWGNNTFTTRWNHVFNDRLFANTSLIISDFDYKSSTSLFGLIGGSPDIPPLSNFQLQTKINDFNLKSTFQLYQNPDLSIRFGGNIIYHNFIPANLIDKFTEEEVGGTSPRDAWENSIFGAAEWNINSQWHLEGGVHFSSLSVVGTGNYIYDFDEIGNRIDSTFYDKNEVITNYFGAEPRLSLTRKMKDNAELNFSYNHTVQYLQLLPSAFANNPASAWLPSSKLIKPQRGHQLNLGYYRSLWKEKFRLSVDAYYIYRFNQIAYRDGANIEFGADLEGQLTFGKSWSYGLEVMLQKEVGKLKGLVSYALSTTRDQFAAINNGKTFRSIYDRPHSIALMLIWSPSSRFTISGSWTYASGKIVTVPIGNYLVNNQTINFYGDRNNYRMSDHHRADVSLQWLRTLENGFKHKWSVSVYNLYFHHNPEFLYIDQFDDRAQEFSFFTVAIPSIKYAFEF